MRLMKLTAQAVYAIGLGHYDYGLQACQQILQRFPHHMRARSLAGQALLEKGLLAEAATHFQAILEIDPENVMARSGLAVALERQGQLRRAIAELELAWETSPGNVDLREGVLNFRAQLERVKRGLELSPAAEARVHLKKRAYSQTVLAFREALQREPDRLDLKLGLAESLWRCGRRNEAEATSQDLLQQAPHLLKAKALLTIISLQKGQDARGVALMHELGIADPSCLVAGPLLREAGFVPPPVEELLEVEGPNTPVPEEVEAAIASSEALEFEEPSAEDLPVLESKASARRPSGSSVAEFRRVVVDLSERVLPSRAQAPRPEESGVYLVVSSAENLRRKYGPHGFEIIDRKLRGLRDTLTSAGYDARLLYVDEVKTLREFSLPPVSAVTSGPVKGLLDQVEARCREQGQTLKHTLLVGNEDVLPFHQFPNPTEDDDPLVYGDTLYTAEGVDPLWAGRSLGRLPDSASSDPSFLAALIDLISSQHADGFRAWGNRGWLSVLQGGWGREEIKSLGYAALVWKEATQAVYQEIGTPKTLHICPPVTERGLEPRWLSHCQFHLFNLHGAENSVYWYGQKDASYPANYPLFPIAMTPEVLLRAQVEGTIVFCEACYGANVISKGALSSLAFQFLRLGAACVVGSTKISYGASEPPLTGADLLAQLFWRNLRVGLPAGESLAWAKKQFVAEVQGRQGYLDGDDQKTLLSFLLLGDPSVKLATAPSKEAKVAIPEPMVAPTPALYCRHRALAAPKATVEGDILVRVRRYLQRLSPDIADSQLTVLPRILCTAHGPHYCGEDCHREQPSIQASAYVITSQKAVSMVDGSQLRRVARVTVDPKGSVLKVSVSK